MSVLPIIVACIIGFFAGLIVNLLADYLPARRHYNIARSSPFTTVKPQLPTFFPRRADGSRWSAIYWSGLITALRHAPVYDPPRAFRRVLVEVGMIIAFALIVAIYQNDPTMGSHVPFLLLYLPPLVLISVIDLEHRFVMIETIFATVIIVLAEQVINPRYPLWLILQAAVYAFVATVALYLLGILFGALVQLISGRRIGRTIFGFGDVQIATLGGLILGTSLLVPALFIMIFSGGIGSLLFILLRKRRRGKYQRFSAIPYGPFICLGIAVALYVPTLAAIVTVMVFGYNPF